MSRTSGGGAHIGQPCFGYSAGLIQSPHNTGNMCIYQSQSLLRRDGRRLCVRGHDRLTNDGTRFAMVEHRPADIYAPFGNEGLVGERNTTGVRSRKIYPIRTIMIAESL